MFIRIKKSAYKYCFGNSQGTAEMKKFLEENAGKLVQVETEHLFNNQYNTDRFRIMDSQVEEVVNDAREGKGRCKYCGAIIRRSEMACYHKVECWNYGIEWFTPENTFFLKYPAGLPKDVKSISATYDKPIKIGSYELYQDEAGGEMLYIIRNSRKTIRFKYEDNRFFIYDHTFGFSTGKRVLDIPETAHNKLIKILRGK